MKNTQGRSCRASFPLKFFVIILILASIFVITSCDSQTDHNCMFQGKKIDSNEAGKFATNISAAVRGTYYYYLGVNMTFSAPLTIPEGVFVGICESSNSYSITLNKTSFIDVIENDPAYADYELLYTAVENNGSVTYKLDELLLTKTVDGVKTVVGGIYAFNCGAHGSHGGNTYYNVEQTMVDLFADSGTNIYTKFAKNGNLNLALTTDITFDSEVFVVPAGYILRLCMNSPDTSDDPNEIYTLAVADGLDLSANGGEVVVFNCQSSTYHECIHLDNDHIFPIDPNNNVSMAQLITKINAIQSGDTFYGYLVNDFTWQGDLAIPEGATALVCLNGFSAKGTVKTGQVTETVTDPETGVTTEVVNNYGQILFFDCSHHICQDICVDGQMLALHSGSYDWTVSLLKQLAEPSDSLIEIRCVLEEDITLQPIEGYDLKVCLNGYADRSSVVKTETVDGVEVVTGRITYYNCASITNDTYHSCEALNLLTGGMMQPNPITVKTFDELNYLFSGFTAEQTYLLYLTSDISGTGEVQVPEGVFATICLNGYSMDGVTFSAGNSHLVFVYECKTQYCSEVGKEIVALDQNMANFIGLISDGNAMSFSYQVSLTFAENVDITGLFEATEEAPINYCTCGYEVVGIEEGAYVAVHDSCIPQSAPAPSLPEYVDLPSYPHSQICFINYLGIPMPVQKLTVDTLDSANADLAAIDAESGFGFYYLDADLDGIGTLTAPEGVIVGICLNGYEISDTVILGDGVYVYECREQYCAECDVTIPALDQRVFDFFVDLSSGDPNSTGPIFTISTDFVFALNGDLSLPDDMFGFIDGAKLYICTNGYELIYNSESVASGDVIIHTECTTGTLNCMVCGRKHKDDGALPFTYDTFMSMVDKEGRVTLPAGSYYFYLENDFQITRNLVIPDGVDMHICLNGYNLIAPYIWVDSRSLGCGYPESTSMQFAMVEQGGVLNIHDCSEYMTGEISLKYFHKDEDGDGIAEVIVSVSTNDSGLAGLGEQLGAALSTFVANIVTNEGTVNIYGGNFNAMVGFINQGNGVINFYRGNLNTVWMGVLQATLSTDVYATSQYVYIGEGATVNSGIAGVYGMSGDVVLDGGTINAGAVGIGLASSSGEASLTLNSGNINVADLGRTLSNMSSVWSAVAGSSNMIDMSGVLGVSEDVTAITVDGNVTMNGDVTITNGNLGELLEKSYTDMVFTKESNITISHNVSNTYSLAVDGATEVGKYDIFVPTEDCMKIVNSEGEIVIMPIPSGGAYASSKGVSVSTGGEITLNVYATVNASVQERVLLYVQYGDSSEPVVYTVNDATAVIYEGKDTYRYAIPVSAKDYATEITYYFILLPAEDESTDSYIDFVGAKMGEKTVSVKEYLDVLIASSDIYGTKAADLAWAMKNYCAAAAKHFGISDTYEVPAEIEEKMDSVTFEDVSEYAPAREGDYENSIAIFKSVTVTLKSTTNIRIYFDIAEGYTLDDVDAYAYFDTAGMYAEDINVTVGESGLVSKPYYVEVSGIYAKDLDKTFSITIDTWTVHYSVMSYVYTVLKTPGRYASDLVDVVKSLVIYKNMAEIYFACDHSYDNECDGCCNGCGYTRSVGSHVAGEAVMENLEAPTSCDGGRYEMATYCIFCNYEMSRYSYYPNATHVPGEPELRDRVESTCQSQGYCYYETYCTACSTSDNKVYVSGKTEYLPYAPHTFGDAVDGNVTCTVCGATCYADGHTPVTFSATEPTCYSQGYNEWQMCSRCNEILVAQVYVPAKGHTPAEAVTQNVVAATCSSNGGYDTVVYCVDCGTELSREHTVTPALDHTPGEPTVQNTVSADCTTAGGYDTVISCTVCSAELYVEHTVTEEALGHTHGEAVIENVQDATCTAGGRADYVEYCSVCDAEVSHIRVIIGKSIAHSYTDGYCTVCGDAEEGGAE